MREVNGRMLHFVFDLARLGVVDEAALLDGLPSLALRDGEAPDWVEWSDFIELFERLETALGGPEGFARAARLAAPTAYPELRAVAAIFLSPMSLFTFVTTRLARTSFPHVQFEELERFEDGRVRWRETIPPQYRGSEAFHRGTRTMAALLPLHLDLPAADAEITSLTAHSAEFIVRFPPAPPLATRGRHAVSAATSLIAAQFDAAFALLVEKTRAARPQTAPHDTPKSIAGWANKLALSPRQRDVFALLVEGRANKDIAKAIQCSERNVEFHVGRILRSARVTSRAELLVKVLGTRG